MSTIPIIPQISLESLSLSFAPSRSSSSRTDTYGLHGNSGGPDSVQVEISASSRLQSDRHAAITMGNHAREVDAMLKSVAALTEEMKEQLLSITKQFPPFAAGSDDRFQFLNGFSGLRAQFESLTFPAEPDVNDEWSQVRLHTEQLNWDIPALDSATASDEDIHMAESVLERIIGDIQQQRRNLYDSVISVIGGEPGVDEARMLAQAVKERLTS